MSIIKVPEILLPNEDVNMEKWSVVACDQYTSEEEYWAELEKSIGEAHSVLKMILPEIYLKKDDKETRILKINKTMNNYLHENVLKNIGKCFILVDRKTKINPRRLGLIVSVDLEAYSYDKKDNSLIRATEETVVERIPARVEIRKNAPIELPHIMLLFDDRKEKIIEKLYDNRENFQKIYDTDLNMDGGHITGYKIADTEEIIQKFECLITNNYLKETFNSEEKILFVVGDGNHSLAAAKIHWENVKKTLNDLEKETHPARFALVEIVNIHDSGIRFEPIYRVIFNADLDFIEGLKMLTNVGRKYTYIKGGKSYFFKLNRNAPFAIKQLQNYIDEYCKKNSNVIVDYVHGLNNLKKICSKNKKTIGIVLPTISKEELFEYVLKYGSLCRKSFSMGESFEKRYYMEGKKIVF